MPRPAHRLWRDDRGAAAVEFSLLGVVFVLLLLGVLQFSLVYVSGLQLRSAVGEVAGSANNPNYPQYRSSAQVRTKICTDLTLSDNCTTNLLLEQMPVSSFSGPAYQPIAGTTYTQGATNDLLVIRAQAPIVTFVPGIPKLYAKATAVWLNK